MNFRAWLGLACGIILIGFVSMAFDAILDGLRILFSVGLGLLVILVLGFGVLYWRREQQRADRLVDGSYPLQRHRIPGGGVLVVDPNKSLSGAYVVHPAIGYREIAPAGGWDMQQIYALAVQTTRHLEALTPGDEAQVRTHGAINGGRAGIANSATGKWLDGAFRPQPKALPPPPAPPPSQGRGERLSLTDALGQSTGSRWIVGQADDGALAAFDPAAHSHAAIVGATGTGKTRSVGFALALAAIRSGWHVLILDPDGGADWSPFRAQAEWHESDRSSFPGQVEAIHTFYERRASLDNPRPVLVVIEEYGDLIRQLRTASRTTADQVDAWLDSILQRGRKRRVHVALIDQYPEHWSQPVVSGTKFRAVFQLGPNQGAKMEEYKAASLGDVGRFLVRGLEYQSWDASAELPGLLRRLPAPASARRVINGTATHVPSGVPAPVRAGVLQEVAPSSPQPTNTQPMTREEREAANQEAARLFCQKYPAQGVNALARHLAELDGRPAAWRNFQSEGSRWWHIYNPRGNDYRLPADSMDLSDDADRQRFEQMLAAGAVHFPEPKEK